MLMVISFEHMHYFSLVDVKSSRDWLTDYFLVDFLQWVLIDGAWLPSWSEGKKLVIVLPTFDRS